MSGIYNLTLSNFSPHDIQDISRSLPNVLVAHYKVLLIVEGSRTHIRKKNVLPRDEVVTRTRTITAILELVAFVQSDACLYLTCSIAPTFEPAQLAFPDMPNYMRLHTSA